MNTFDIILLSIGLAMDCLAVSVSTGISYKKIDTAEAIKMPVMFGLFQGLMPLAGFFLTISFAEIIDSVSHWIALVILSFIGIKMIWEELHETEDEVEEKKNLFAWSNVLILAVATSIDALSTGIIFVPVPEKLYFAVIIIGITSFLFSIAGLFVGNKIQKAANLRFGIIGGVILIAFGVKLVVVQYFI